MNRTIAVTLAVCAALLGACSPSTAEVEGAVPGATGAFRILSCSLGCSTPLDGSISCSLSEVHQNQTLSFEFNKPVDPASLSTSTVRVSRLDTGQVIPAIIQVDPTNPRRVLYKAKVAPNDAGVYVPGFELFQSYRVLLRSGAGGSAVRSIDGGSNSTPLECVVTASKGPLDLEPGPPSATALVEVLDPVSKNPIASFSADGATDVPLLSRVRIEFDQIMSASSLIDTVQGTSPTVKVRYDEDGDLGTTSDQVPLPGFFGILFDEAQGRTSVIFVPTPQFPSSGVDPLALHRVVVDVSKFVTDIAGENLVEPLSVAFTPASVPIDPVVVVDAFSGEQPVDLRGSSAKVDAFATVAGQFQGRLIRSFGGGTGRLGTIVVREGETLELSTGPSVPTRFGPLLTNGAKDAFGLPSEELEEIVAYDVRSDVLDDYVGARTAPGEIPLEVGDGVFEFASLVVEPGAALRFVGELPPRVFVRGIARIEGLVDVSGADGAQHLSTVGQGAAGASARAGGGAGGDGGDRPDQGGGLLASGGTFRGYNHPTGSVVDITGAAGEGRGGAAAGSAGGAGGGVSWPPVFPGPSTISLGSLADPGYLNALCAAVEVGAPGAGGGYATAGGTGLYSTPAQAFGVPLAPPLADVSTDLLRADEFDLDPDRGGALLGGAGGGGGGAGIQGTTTNGSPTNNCLPIPPAFFLLLNGYLDGSGGGGGAGGGALQLQAGLAIELLGRFDLSGGAGSGIPLCTPITDGCWMAPGGGGSGGALLLQTRELDLGLATDAIDLRGGTGGVNGNSLSRGGDGGTGVLRVETAGVLPDAEVTAHVVPALGGAGRPAIEDVVSLGEFTEPPAGPGRVSGFTSCFSKPEVGVFGFDFTEDDFSSPDAAAWTYGWNLLVELDSGEVVEWRGDSGPIVDEFGVDLETLLGNTLGSSPVVVRFQGVRLQLAPQNRCLVDATAPLGNAVPDSLTPWLATPAELNTYWGETVAPNLADERRPNAFRVQVVLDPDAPLADRIASIVEVRVVVQPR